jgi:glycerol-3-phosphate dehydrogenase
MPGFSRPLPRARFDLAIVGGGVHGLFAAREAALRGWKVVLVERDDFGSGLSFNHQRTVHGGLRTLQTGKIGRTREQIGARREWALMVPHLVKPLPFLMPTERSFMRSRLAIGTAFRLYDWLGTNRNEGLPGRLHLPPARILSRGSACALFPALEGRNVTGGALWHDYQLRHPDRFNGLLAGAAVKAGAVLFNHVEAVGIAWQEGRVAGLEVRDTIDGGTGTLQAARVLLCAGGGIVDDAARSPGVAPPLLVRASNLVLDRRAGDTALAARGASGRMLTATPWDGLWLVGTFQTDTPVAPGTELTEEDVAAMLADANSAFGFAAGIADVRVVHSGFTPAVLRGGRAELMPESAVEVLAEGLFSVTGVKFTTARRTALVALDLMGLLPTTHGVVHLKDLEPQPLPHGTSDGANELLAAACRDAGVWLDPDVQQHLVDWYGTEAADVVRMSAAAARLQRLVPDRPILEGELIYAIERSQALRLADIVLRRTHLGTSGHPGREALGRAAEIVATYLSWSSERRDEEVARVEERFAIPGAPTER